MPNQTGGNGQHGNRSQAVREAIAENPKAGSKEIIALLAKKGIKVSATLVYYVRSKQNQQKRRQKRERLAEASRQTGTSNPVEVVRRVKHLARDVGGIRSLKQLVDLLAE
jgi:tRNA G37 N-methylase Trm5